MGCGVSKDCIADQARIKRKKRLIHACREQLQLAMAEVACKNTTSASSPHHEYIHITESASIEEEEGEEEEVITINHDELEYLENKPPLNQHVTSHNSPAPIISLSTANASSINHAKKSPLRELSTSANGKLIAAGKDNHGGNFTTMSTSSARSNHYYSGISPSRPCAKAKANACSPLKIESVKPLSPMQAWIPNEAKSPNFIKAIADYPLSGKAENMENDTTFKVGSTYNPFIQHNSSAKTGVVHSDIESEELIKSNTSINIDEFIENLQANPEHGKLEKTEQEAYDSDQLAARLMAWGSLSSSPNSYMRELLEHFDKSTEPLHMPTTPRMASWQSKLLETLDRDIDNILLHDQAEVASSVRHEREEDSEHGHIDHTRYESNEL